MSYRFLFVISLFGFNLLFSQNPTWNIQMVRADSAWVYGYDGNNVIIAMITDGVDTTHPALQGKIFRYYTFGAPTTFNGTGEAGVIAGGDGLGAFPLDIGVAPGAKIVVIATEFSYIQSAMQFVRELKVDSGFDIKVVYNSWNLCSRTYTGFWNTIRFDWLFWEIFPVFKIGDNLDCGTSPSDSGTVSAPANYPIVMGVGTVGMNGCYDSIGQRGPAPDTIPWNDPDWWFYPTWNLLKPDIAAPGSKVYTSIAGGNYDSLDGSSLAGAHVAGALAILYQANPVLTIDSLYLILINTTIKPDTCGYSYPNNMVGWGIVNVWEALKTQLSVEEEKKQIFPSFNLRVQRLDKGRKITFTLPPNTKISLNLFDVSGKIVKKIWEGYTESGSHEIFLNTENFKKGIYFLNIRTLQRTKTLKLFFME